MFERINRKLSKIYCKLRTYVPIEKIPYSTDRLGSNYGGWIYAITPSIRKEGNTIIACGAGEDISFDIEIASRYKSLIYIVDPTPRSIKHVDEVLTKVGQIGTKSYSNTGKQSITNYDLKNIKAGQIKFIKKALWNQSKKIKFFSPIDPSHVSHSIVNYQNNYSQDSISIDVDAITIEDLFEIVNLNNDIEILKLDIEGAEHEVLYDMISSQIFPKQLLVEYDELNFFGFHENRSLKRFKRTHKMLIENNYVPFARENNDFSYIRI